MPPSSTLPPRIAEFRLERLLGSGASAQVWLARDTLLDRDVALKIANAAAAPAIRARFRIEARAIARLQHPNILAVHHVGELEARPFLVTEYIPGKSLDKLPLPMALDRVLTIATDLARGLSAAHRAGVLHRDIKPANAFWSDDGIAKLLDFGLAKLSDEPMPPMDGSTTEPLGWSRAALEATGTPARLTARGAGTPLYMAPETWRGEPATRATDVYSLGALIFELLTSVPPCIAALADGVEINMLELKTRVLRGELGRLEEMAPFCPTPLVDLIARCLSLHPDERPAAEAMCDALVRALPRPASLVADALDDARVNPYRGLLAFGPEHRALFFGREAETATVIAELRAGPFVLVTGASGAGKSSLVRAGVVPRIEKGALGPPGTPWRVVILVPGSRPVEALAEGVAPLLGASQAEVTDALAQSPTWLADELRSARQRVLLVLDQMEELWTLATPADRASFLTVLSAVVQAAPTVRTVATLRADFLGRLDEMGELQGHALRALVVLRPMTSEGLRRAIVEPALRRGVVLEPALVERLLTATEAGSLPLLEFALGQLYAQRDPGKLTLGVAELDAIGGVEGALALHGDATLARMPPSQRRAARRLLLDLVTVERTRSRREAEDLLGRLSAGELVDGRGALDALVEARLVVAGAGEHGASYEVAHEALLSGWATLRSWLNEEAEAREAAERVGRAAQAWERAGRPEDALFEAKRLEELDAVGGLALDTSGSAFLAASRAATRRERRRRFLLRVGVPLVALMTATAVILALRFRERAATRAFVAARLAEEDAALRAVRDLDARVTKARAAAFSHFDEGDTTRGEAAWQTALALARREAEALFAASAPLGVALARAPEAKEVRARAADLTYAWLLAAERDHQADVARDLRARLAQLDDDGSRRARLAAPASLEVSTVPKGAKVVLHAVHRDESGHWVEDEGRGIELGATLDVTPGSYVLAASADGRYPTRLPILLSRGRRERVEVVLPAAAEVPPGFVYIPAGVSLLGAADVEGVRRALSAEPEHPVWISAFVMGRHEVTYEEYLTFLASLPEAVRAARRPHAASLDVTFDGRGVPTLAVRGTSAARGEKLCRPKRSVRRCQDWLRFPVTGISADDAEAFAVWLSASGRVPGARLCTDAEWERAARGADGRPYPHGDVLRAGDANFDESYDGDPDQLGADEVGSFANDESPFGVLDLAGNAAEWAGRADARAPRGGFWSEDSFGTRVAGRGVHDGVRLERVGARVCAAAPTVR